MINNSSSKKMEVHSEKTSGVRNPHWKSNGTVEESYGGEYYKIGVKGLNIIWGDDQRFWQFTQLSEEDTRLTGFREGAVLLQVNWIEVTGKIAIRRTLENTKSQRKMKIIYWVKFREDAFGWHSVEIKFKLKFNGKEMVIKSCNFETFRENDEEKWHEINGGDFTIEDDGALEFGMYEIESDWWKGGIILGGVDIKPIS